MRLPLTVALLAVVAPSAHAVLGIDPENPFAFADDGEPVYLMGDYCWDTFSMPSFPHEEMFDIMVANDLNFSRVWVFWGFTDLREDEPLLRTILSPYQRPGPGVAADGRPKTDVTQWDEAFFARLRDVVAAADERGIYLQLCLFDGWALKNSYSAWDHHVFHRDNNINGLDGDPNGDGQGHEYGELVDDRVLELQKQFIDKVLETVGDYGNIFFEIANENPNMEWELHLAEYIHERERGAAVQHLVMPADLPNHFVTQSRPWAYETARSHLLGARRVGQPLILDTDGIGEPENRLIAEEAWATFMTGGYFSFLDVDMVTRADHVLGSDRQELRRYLSILARVANSIEFNRMEPSDELIRTDDPRLTCLSSPLDAVVYVRAGFAGNVEVALADFAYEARVVDTLTGESPDLGAVRGPVVSLTLGASGNDRALVLSVPQGPRGDQGRG